MHETTIKLRQAFKDVESTLEACKKEFQAHMADKSVPLDERWNLFKKAPEYVGEHESFIATFKSIDDDTDWFENIERHQTIDNRDLVEDFEFDLKYHNEEFTTPHEWLSEQLIVNLKEEILSNSFMTWVMDW